MAALLKLRSITEPLRLEYDATHYVSHVVGSDGSYTITPKGTSGVVMPVKFGQQDGIILQFPTSEVGRNFNVTLKSFPNDPAAGGRVDSVLRIGYNVGPGGGPATAGEHALAIEMENYWYQAGQGIWTEFHAAYTSKVDAATRRLWSWLIDVNADTCQMYFQSGSYDFRDFGPSGSEGSFMFLNNQNVTVNKPVYLPLNDVNLLEGQTAAGGGGRLTVLKVNAADEIQLGGGVSGANNTSVRVPGRLKVGNDDGSSSTAAQIRVYGGADSVFNDLLVLQAAGNSGGIYAGTKWQIATPDYGRIGWSGAWYFLTNTGAGGDTLRARVFDDISLFTAGKGLVVTSPDGTHTYRIAVDNTGAVTSTLVS